MRLGWGSQPDAGVVVIRILFRKNKRPAEGVYDKQNQQEQTKHRHLVPPEAPPGQLRWGERLAGG
jgi:hypothetical protein